METIIIDSILAINPSAIVTVRGSDIDACTIEWLEGTSPISKDDIKVKIAELTQAKIDADDQKTADKASAVSKLEVLGLTSSEIDALTK